MTECPNHLCRYGPDANCQNPIHRRATMHFGKGDTFHTGAKKYRKKTVGRPLFVW